ncbi:ammonium transporter [Sphingomonas sp. KR3-1]|uniref:ammonium transporter n=1 Tax=Sphingomonas sp. KR3-1 TaxID=3156611 RepID=UPI0032B32FE5
MKEEARKELSGAVGWAAAMIALAFVAAFAHRQGYIDDDMKVRVIAMNGLWIAWYGNRIPKAFVPSACARAAKRVIGWSMVLSGLVYAGVFAFAPMPLALTLGTGAVLTGILVSLGYSLWLATKAKTKTA